MPAAQSFVGLPACYQRRFCRYDYGKGPWENSVFPGSKDLKVPSYLDLPRNWEEFVLIEGHIKILNTEVEPILNIDLNQDGYNEDEIFQSAIDRLNDGYDLMMVHFHSIDDAGHDYGELDQGTMDAISKVDGYIEQLVQGWDGKVIILSDHGMHSTPEGGSHGVFRYEDLVVPYILAEGGLLN